MQRLLGSYKETISLGLWSRHKLYFRHLGSEHMQSKIKSIIERDPALAKPQVVASRIAQNDLRSEHETSILMEVYYANYTDIITDSFGDDDSEFLASSVSNVIRGGGISITKPAPRFLIQQYLRMGFNPNIDFIGHVFKSSNNHDASILELLSYYGLEINELNTQTDFIGGSRGGLHVRKEHILRKVLQAQNITWLKKYVELGGDINLKDESGLSLVESDINTRLQLFSEMPIVEFYNKLFEWYTNIHTPFFDDVVKKDYSSNLLLKKFIENTIVYARKHGAFAMRLRNLRDEPGYQENIERVVREVMQLRRDTSSRLSYLAKDVVDTLVAGYVLADASNASKLSKEETAKAAVLNDQIVHVLSAFLAEGLISPTISHSNENGAKPEETLSHTTDLAHIVEVELNAAMDNVEVQLGGMGLLPNDESDAALAAAPARGDEPDTSGARPKK